MFNEMADQLTDQLTHMGNAIAKSRKNGVCSHGWLMESNGLITCNDCKRVFLSFNDALIAGREILSDYM
jgi:hypothetical protein